MKKRFNPFTGTLDYVGDGGGGGSSLTIKDVVDAILLDSDETATLPVASILFDNDSILYNDDGEL
jgi:hypothetical protein